MCGCVSKENRLSQERFSCVDCGHTENADIHASKNILARALEDCDKAHAWLSQNPMDLKTVVEAKPRNLKKVCIGVAKLAGVHHWTTVQQVARLLTETNVL
jgi:hypothetical protein